VKELQVYGLIQKTYVQISWDYPFKTS
jgi:hypothetical protein